jgi:hypothetical protein
MNMLRTILIVILALPLIYFTWWNDGFVLINDVAFAVLGFGSAKYEVDVRVVVLVAFLLGFVPLWLLGTAQRLIWRRRLTKLENRLGDVETELEQAKVELLRPPAAPVRSAAVAVAPVVEPELPPQAPVPPAVDEPLPDSVPPTDSDPLVDLPAPPPADPFAKPDN